MSAADRRADRIVSAARALTATPDDMTVRTDYVKATFNHDETAAGIVALADRPHLAVLSLKDGDILVANAPLGFRPAQIEALRANLEALIERVGVKAEAVVGGGFEFSIARAVDDQAPE